MMYFLDTEFLEGTQKKYFGLGTTKPTIDLISIGIVAEDGREYYAISKDFNLKEAWNRWQQRTGEGDRNNIHPKHYWLRENVLFPIFHELVERWAGEELIAMEKSCTTGYNPPIIFTYRNMKKLIKRYGKSNQQIKEVVYNFCSNDYHKGNNLSYDERIKYDLYNDFKPELYGYYSAYDHVVLCWLFGHMIDLPKGFPMFTNDIQQMLVEKHKLYLSMPFLFAAQVKYDFDEWFNWAKSLTGIDKQINQHNALDDAKWNKLVFDKIISNHKYV